MDRKQRKAREQLMHNKARIGRPEDTGGSRPSAADVRRAQRAATVRRITGRGR